jgi:hypothetical protein
VIVAALGALIGISAGFFAAIVVFITADSNELFSPLIEYGAKSSCVNIQENVLKLEIAKKEDLVAFLEGAFGSMASGEHRDIFCDVELKGVSCSNEHPVRLLENALIGFIPEVMTHDRREPNRACRLM